ncbi:hypothetical protein SARC_00229 [Sphaeroforma arctica JP610]|uniref:Polysaccharide lyase 14 domain-containing protein n=1 Tax=Sphaeroforma arctica JP610 TaxID=667725 RepID=A0A0L0GH51_9EUKA|nr:hypothetical protein SARC_00229 [Sphaeroforma arctica JP610]KNC87658.1 hypothetical protein SARC_00229 [Sphaeroforma arctica JP610]|eukprot:XP_014161560.1 hypothetical protein SARC_00229 [Sphaeroforma arctica JP610]
MFRKCICAIVIVASSAVLAAPMRRSATALSVSNFNSYNVDDALDVYEDFKAPFMGCYGMQRKGSDCTADRQNDAFIIADPSSSSTKVMEIKMKAGAHGTNQHSGGQFNTLQFEDYAGLDEATLEYSVFFPSDFEWVKGGKLPGLHGGASSGKMQCSGGTKSTGTNCWSTRLMWRENGAGEVYLYAPMSLQSEAFCKRCDNMSSCSTSEATCSLNRGSWSFQRGSWSHVKQTVRLNTVGSNDGQIKLWVNGNLVMSETIVLRSTDSVTHLGMFYSVFYGGSGSSYAPKTDQSLQFKNFKLTAGL